MPNNWISFVKEFASKNNLKYGDAMSAPECKKQYREKDGETKSLPIQKKKEVVVVEPVPAVSSEKIESTGMKRPKLVKGSQEAKDYMKMLRDKRGTMKKQEKKMMGKGKGGLFEEEGNEWELFDEGELLDEMEGLDKKPDNEETNKMNKLVKKPKPLTEEQKQRKREDNKKHYAANKEELKRKQREYAKKYYEKNKEDKKESNRAYKEKNKEKLREYHIKKYQEKKSGTVPAVSSEKMEGTGMKRPKLVKGSQEAKDYMKMLRDKRGKEDNKM